MIKLITADLEVLQKMIEALDMLELRYTIRNMYLPVAQVKELFVEMNREYDGAKVGLQDIYAGLMTGYSLSNDTIIPVWTISLHRG